MNIYDISERAGVSIATVSRVLNDSPHVSESTRARVLAVIEESGYVPNAFARGLGLNSMRTIGLLCPDASDPYLSHALSVLERNFRQQGYDCILICTGRQLPERENGLKQLMARHVDAAVLMGSSFVEETEEGNACIREAAASVPVAILNGVYNSPNVYSLACHDVQITAQAVSALVRSGHRRVLYLGIGANQSAMNKLRGYRRGLRQNNITPRDKLICMLPQGRPQLEDVIALLQEKRRATAFDAVMCAEDLLGIAAVKFAQRERIRVPEELSVIGYNNSIYCQLCEPELSSVDNQLEPICDAIVETLVSVLDGQGAAAQKVLFPGELITRGTTEITA